MNDTRKLVLLQFRSLEEEPSKGGTRPPGEGWPAAGGISERG